jgi:glucose dehydrogenase
MSAQVIEYDTLIVGSGFAGRTVASHLREGSYLILERGEDRSHGETLKRYRQAVDAGLGLNEAEKRAFQSDLPFNRFERLSRYNYSNFALIRGGASNWWGGKSTRFSREVFESAEGLRWPMRQAAMDPWYELAERRLNVSGDPVLADAPPIGAIEGAAVWRTAFAPYLQPSNVYNTALNKRDAEVSATGQGRCVGRGHCAMCEDDAKARPDNIFPEHNTLYQSLVHDIQFDGDTARSVQVFDGRQLFEVRFNRLVLAANGVETPRLLARSGLPSGVNVASLGRYCQDHAHLEFICHTPKPIPYGAIGGLTHVQVLELSKMYPTALGQIETSALAITHEPGHEGWYRAAQSSVLRDHGLQAFRRHLQGTFRIFIELETVMQIDARVDLESEVARIDDPGYSQLIPEFDRIAQEMAATLEKRGVGVLQTLPHYRSGYGGHHFVGTTNWSDGPHNMMEDDGRLGGTANVYIAGASVLPRAGGVAPTLTLVALAERLGAALARKDAHGAAA